MVDIQTFTDTDYSDGIVIVIGAMNPKVDGTTGEFLIYTYYTELGAPEAK